VQINANFYAYLAIHYHQINLAVGIRRVTPQVALFLTCHLKARQKLQAEYIRGELLHIQLKNLMTKFSTLDTESQDKVSVLKKANEIYAQALYITTKLEANNA